MPTFITQYFSKKQDKKDLLNVDDFEFIDECVSKELNPGGNTFFLKFVILSKLRLIYSSHNPNLHF